MTADKHIEEATKRVKAKKEFYKHVIIFGVFHLILLMANLLTFDGKWWVQYSILGWGFGLAIHYLQAFGVPGVDFFDRDWEAREIQKELHKMRGMDKSDSSSKSAEQELELRELRPDLRDEDLV